MRTLLGLAALAASAASAAAQSGTQILMRGPGDSVRVFVAQRVSADEVRALYAELETMLAGIRKLESQIRGVGDSVARDARARARLLAVQDGLIELYSELYPTQSRLTLACAALRANATGRDGYLGVSFGQTMNLQSLPGGGTATWSDGPTRVDQVEPGSPADRAGVREGDELIAVGGRPATDLTDAYLDEVLKPGARVVLRLRSAPRERAAPRSAERDVEVVVGRRPEFPARECGAAGGFAIAPPLAGAFAGRFPSIAPPAPGVRGTPAKPQVASVGVSIARVALFGASFRVLDADVRDVVKVDGDGVLVDHVSPGTPAHAAGLRSFDVVTRVNGNVVKTPFDVRRSLEEERTLVLTVVRAGESRTVTLIRK